MKPNRFILLCEESRCDRYFPCIEAVSYEVEVVTNADDVFRLCVERAPYAVIVDMVSGMHLNSERLNILYNLSLAWPVVRCRTRHDGPFVIISTNPINRSNFEDALGQIATGDPAWQPKETIRRDIRVELQLRARWRNSGTEADWKLGTILNLSAGGCFLHLYENQDLGTEMELEILDLVEFPLHIEGKVVWRRSWDDGVMLPGMGVTFESGEGLSELRANLATRSKLK